MDRKTKQVVDMGTVIEAISVVERIDQIERSNRELIAAAIENQRQVGILLSRILFLEKEFLKLTGKKAMDLE